MGNIKLFIDVFVKDTKTGNVEKHIHRKSHSFDLQFLQLFEYITTHTYGVGGAGVSIKDTGNTARAIQTQVSASNEDINVMALYCPNADVTYGIIVGTGSNATSPSDVVLQTPIANGAGAGQLGYGSHSKVTSAISGSNVNFIVSRPFANTSGGSISVTEVGMYVAQVDSAGVVRIFCIVRDLITAVPVPNNKTLTVQYTFTTAN
jgi:hypothetical protein